MSDEMFSRVYSLAEILTLEEKPVGVKELPAQPVEQVIPHPKPRKRKKKRITHIQKWIKQYR